MLIVNHLNKSYKSKSVISNLSFRAKPASINLIVGQNGSGKSTLLKLLCGVEKYDSGEIELNGFSVSKHDYHFREHIGFYLGEDWLIKKFRADEFLDFIQMTNGAKREIAQKNTQYWLQYFNLENETEYIESFSTGMKKIVGFISAIIVPKKYILLDEPFENLDDKNIKLVVKALLNILENQKSTFIISTHNLQLLSGLAEINTVINMDEN